MRRAAPRRRATQARSRRRTRQCALPWRDWPENLRATLYLAQVSLLAPGPGTPPEANAEADSVARWLDAAERSARHAIALAPQRAINRQTLGNIEFARARMGDSAAVAGAIDAYRDCWQRAPVNALAMLQFSFEAMRLGRADLAIEPARRAAALYPGEGLTQAVLGEASLAVADTVAAVNALTHALANPWRGVPYARADIERQLLRLRARRAQPEPGPGAR